MGHSLCDCCRANGRRNTRKMAEIYCAKRNVEIFFFLISPAMIWVIASCIASVFPSGLALSPPISLAECRFTVGATNRPPPTSIERTEFASYLIHTKIVICDFNSNIYALSPHSHIYWNFQFWPLSDSRHH